MIKTALNSILLFSTLLLPILTDSQHHQLNAESNKHITKHLERIEHAYDKNLKDSDENLIALDLFLDIEESCLNKDYTSAILLIDKIIYDYHLGKLGKPLIYNRLATGVGREYCYFYRNKIYDFALTYKAILLCKSYKINAAQSLLEKYLNDIDSSNGYSEDYIKNFLNDENFMKKYSSKWDKAELKFAIEVSQRNNEGYFWDISQHRPDKKAFKMLIAIHCLKKDKKQAQKILDKFTKKIPEFEKKFKYKELINLDEFYLTNILDDDKYIFWNICY